MTDHGLSSLLPALERVAVALERMAPTVPAPPDLSSGATAFVWHATPDQLQPVASVDTVAWELLAGIESQQQTLLQNTRRFSEGFPANNALLWGARGTGKSSLVKAVHQKINATRKDESPLLLIEIHREDLPTLPRLLQRLAHSAHRCLLFCDDLSFESQDDSYKSLKAVLDGGLRGRPDHVLFYATSNRRHLMPRDMADNEAAIHASESVEETVSLSDRFGLWIGFHNCTQDNYLAMITGYLNYFDFPAFTDDQRQQIIAEAKEWSVTRGARSGRVAWQFIQNLAGQYRVRLSRN